jgi:translation initiation factor IF-3
VRFLEEGNKVKITIMLRGRERSRPEMGQQVLARIVEDVGPLGHQDGGVRKQDWAVSALLVPVKVSGGKDAKAKVAPGSPQEVQGHGEQKDLPQEGQ